MKSDMNINQQYPYTVSVIIPVYNAEESLQRCLNSILNQTFNNNQIQIILINNNSTDKSLEICYGYSHTNCHIEVYNESTSGVSYARNLGLEKSRGKYIMFLDADDYLDKNTVSSVIDFFEKHYNEIDLVTYHETRIENEVCKEHLRYNYLVNTGIYDLNDNYYICQVRLNICIKNVPNQIQFDTGMNFQEDQKFCSEILMNKMKIGYVSEGNYFYEVQENGLTNHFLDPSSYFEISTGLFEEIFSKYKDKGCVPRYFQGLFFHDLLWKFKSNRLWPYHYTAEEFERAKKRIISLLNFVENEVILNYPGLDKYELIYWIRQKENTSITPFINENGVRIYCDSKEIYKREKLEIILKKLIVSGKKYKMAGFFKSLYFTDSGKPEASIIINGQKHALELKDCAAGYYKVKEKTNTFWSFEYEGYIAETTSVQFEIIVNGFEQEKEFFFMPTVPFKNNAASNSFAMGDLIVEVKDDAILFRAVSLEEWNSVFNSWTKRLQKKKPSLYKIRNIVRNFNCAPVWLYTDATTVTKDNGFYQFINDIDKEDGIERYYVITNPDMQLDDLADNVLNHMIEFRSEKHQILFFKAEKIITSFIDKEVIWPYASAGDRKQMMDLFHAEIIYLQHGVLHAHLPWYYSKVVSGVDKVIISSRFEYENFQKNYDFNQKDLIFTGMPRYDVLRCDADSKEDGRHILFAPSWRSYLMDNKNKESLTRSMKSMLLLETNYYRNIMEFLSDERLNDFLTENNLYLDVKMHPEFYKGDLTDLAVTSERICFLENETCLKDVCALITDFSSILYDYVFLKKPVIYFIPDYTEFKAGLNHYRELDIPLESGFGEVTFTPEDVLKALKNLSEHSFQPLEIYRERIDSFFGELNDCRENIYYAILNEV